MRYIVLHDKRFRVADIVVMLYLVGVNGVSVNNPYSETDIIEKIHKLSDEQERVFNEYQSDYGQKLT